jgi:hypothetical protein
MLPRKYKNSKFHIMGFSVEKYIIATRCPVFEKKWLPTWKDRYRSRISGIIYSSFRSNSYFFMAFRSHYTDKTQRKSFAY